MKRSLLIFLMPVFFSVYAKEELSLKEDKISRLYGGDAKLVFRVVDDEGKPVKDAKINIGFYMFKDEGNPKASGFTDEDGFCTLGGRCVGEIYYGVRKDGFYNTRERINLKTRKDGKWQPYGETRTVILKPIKNPRPNIAYIYGKLFNKKDESFVNKPMEFDLKIGDFLPPYGRGVVADFTLIYCVENEDSKVVLSFPNAVDGAYLKEKYTPSASPSDYHANTNAIYQKEFILKPSLKENQYLTLRTRTKVNEKGELIEAYYSKIHGPMVINKFQISIKYFLNPDLNETNLECAFPYKFKNCLL